MALALADYRQWFYEESGRLRPDVHRAVDGNSELFAWRDADRKRIHIDIYEYGAPAGSITLAADEAYRVRDFLNSEALWL